MGDRADSLSSSLTSLDLTTHTLQSRASRRRTRRDVSHVARRARRVRLPLNRSLFRCIDVLAGAASEEERRQVVRQERACLRIHHIETVMIDQHGLLLEPIAPALLADFLNDTGADLSGEGSTVEAGARLAAAGAFHIRHDNPKSIRTRLGASGAVQTAIEFNRNVKCRASARHRFLTSSRDIARRYARELPRAYCTLARPINDSSRI